MIDRLQCHSLDLCRSYDDRKHFFPNRCEIQENTQGYKSKNTSRTTDHHGDSTWFHIPHSDCSSSFTSAWCSLLGQRLGSRTCDSAMVADFGLLPSASRSCLS